MEKGCNIATATQPAPASKHWFQFASWAILAFFLGILIYVTAVAFSRQSGSTGMDVATIQKIRYEAAVQHQNPQ